MYIPPVVARTFEKCGFFFRGPWLYIILAYVCIVPAIYNINNNITWGVNKYSHQLVCILIYNTGGSGMAQIILKFLKLIIF